MSDMHANTELQKMKLREKNLRSSIEHLEKKVHVSPEEHKKNVQDIIDTAKDKHEKIRKQMTALRTEDAGTGDDWKQQLAELDHMMRDVDKEYQKALAYFH